MPPMSRDDLLRFYAATPIWLWPVLWWNLMRLDRAMAALVPEDRGLARIFTDGRGHLRVEWIARAGPADPFCYLTDFAHHWADLDLCARLAEIRTGWTLPATLAPRRANACAALADAPLEPG